MLYGMPRTTTLITLAILLAFGNVAQTLKAWPQEPTGFKNLPFGSSRKEAKSILHFKLGDCPRFENTPCVLKLDAGGFTLTANLQFENKQFVEALGTFSSENYSEVRDMFVSLYGPPHDVHESEVQNQVGGRFKQESLHWNGARAYVTLMRYGSTITDGIFVVGLVSVRDAEEVAREAAKKKALR